MDKVTHDPMDPVDVRVPLESGGFTLRAYNAYERELRRQGKHEAVRANWEKRHGLENC